MGFLNPVLLLAGLTVAVPLLLHLLHRNEQQRISFPALQYLLRTEKDHARKIRLRQWLLLALRCVVVILIALAGARTVLRGGGAAHPPTAVAIILDNSLSSQRVVGGARVLDSLKARALDVALLAGEDDRIWVLRAGEPWDVAPPQDRDGARDRIAATEPSDAAGNLAAALRRADRLLDDAGFDRTEIHLLSDLQASAFPRAEDPAPPRHPVVVYRGLSDPEPNRYVRSVMVGGGLAPRSNRRTEVAITVGASRDDTVSAPVRLFLSGQLRGAADAPAQSTVLLPAGPFPEGPLEGYAETDPDALRADDRRYMVTHVGPPPAVAVVGDAGGFLREALAVLEEGGRISRSGPEESDVLFSVAGAGLDRRRVGQRVVVLPSLDPALRTATNQRLLAAGLGAQLGPASAGLCTGDDRTGVGLDSIRLDLAWAVDGEGDVLVRRSDGIPWLVGGSDANGAWALLGSPIHPEATSLPLDAIMIPFLEWLSSGPGRPADAGLEAGDRLPLSTRATQVESPDGVRHPIDATHEFRFTRTVGIYGVYAGDSLIDRVAVNAPLTESRLAPIEADALELWLGEDAVVLEGASAWARGVFLARSGQELWRLLLVATLLLLLAESWVAASGRGHEAKA